MLSIQKPLSQAIGFVAVLWGQPSQKDKDALGCPVLSYADVADKGRQNLTGFEANPIKISGSDLATLVYTSGTTGNPKVLVEGNVGGGGAWKGFLEHSHTCSQCFEMSSSFCGHMYMYKSSCAIISHISFLSPFVFFQYLETVELSMSPMVTLN